MAPSKRPKATGMFKSKVLKEDEKVTTVVEAAEVVAPPPKKMGRPKTMKQVVVWIPLSAHRQLKKIAYEEERTLQVLIAEALNMLFTDRDEPPIV